MSYKCKYGIFIQKTSMTKMSKAIAKWAKKPRDVQETFGIRNLDWE